MTYIKSVLAGLTTLIVTVIALMLWISATTPGQVGFDVVSLAKQPLAWVYTLVLFGLGFGWELRRLRK